MTIDPTQNARHLSFPRPQHELLVFPIVQNFDDPKLVPQMESNRKTPRSRDFWTMVYQNFDKVLFLRSQQRVVNIILVGRFFRGLQLDVLAEKDFANGHLFSIENIDGLPEDPYVIHFSWTSNLAHKMKKCHLAGLWYL